VRAAPVDTRPTPLGEARARAAAGLHHTSSTTGGGARSLHPPDARADHGQPSDPRWGPMKEKATGRWAPHDPRRARRHEGLCTPTGRGEGGHAPLRTRAGTKSCTGAPVWRACWRIHAGVVTGRRLCTVQGFRWARPCFVRSDVAPEYARRVPFPPCARLCLWVLLSGPRGGQESPAFVWGPVVRWEL